MTHILIVTPFTANKTYSSIPHLKLNIQYLSIRQWRQDPHILEGTTPDYIIITCDIPEDLNDAIINRAASRNAIIDRPG